MTMKLRRLTIDILYDDADTDGVVVLLDKMTTDWLHGEGIAEWKEELGEPHEDFSRDDWEYFWEYNEATDEWLPVN